MVVFGDGGAQGSQSCQCGLGVQVVTCHVIQYLRRLGALNAMSYPFRNRVIKTCQHEEMSAATPDEFRVEAFFLPVINAAKI